MPRRKTKSRPTYLEYCWGEIHDSSRKDLQELSRQWEAEHQPRPDLPLTLPLKPCPFCQDDERWERGHKPGWWVCPDCLTVFPCFHQRSGITDDGTCCGCGDQLSEEQLAEDEARKQQKEAERLSMVKIALAEEQAILEMLRKADTDIEMEIEDV